MANTSRIRSLNHQHAARSEQFQQAIQEPKTLGKRQVFNDIQAENCFIFTLNFGEAYIRVLVFFTDIHGVIYAAITGSQKLAHDPKIAGANVQHTWARAHGLKVKLFDLTKGFTSPPAPDRKARHFAREELLSPPVVVVYQVGVHGTRRSC